MAKGAYVGVVFGLNALAIIVHFFGLYCLVKQRRWQRENQSILMFNLSLLELLILATTTIQSSLVVVYGPKDTYVHITRMCEFSEWLSLFLLMIYISIDRLLRAGMGANYNRKITVKVTRSVLVFVWLTGWVSAAPLYVVGIVKSLGIIYSYVYVILDVVVILAAIIAYIAIIILLKSKHNTVRPTSQNIKVSTRINWKPYLVPMLIVFTFFIFYAIPDWSLAINKNYSFTHEYIARILWALGLTADPLIYIVFVPKSRRVFLNSFRRQQRRNGSIRAPRFSFVEHKHHSSTHEHESI